MNKERKEEIRAMLSEKLESGEFDTVISTSTSEYIEILLEANPLKQLLLIVLLAAMFSVVTFLAILALVVNTIVWPFRMLYKAGKAFRNLFRRKKNKVIESQHVVVVAA